MEIMYDKKNDKLIYVDKSATEEFWDDHWHNDNLRNKIIYSNKNFVSNITKKYLTNGSKILEGGCGRANNVFSLKKSGFKVLGVDFAKQTVKKVNELMPELDIRLGDVRKLNIKSNSFDGYWSLGVIEHFWEGYDLIAKEMYRVLLPGGYLFLTFPSMSNYRRYKARKNYFKLWNNKLSKPEGFYQYALNPDDVIKCFQNLGFELISQNQLDGLKGFKDHSDYFKPLLNRIYNSNNLTFKILRKFLNILLSKKCGHISILIMQKNK